VVSRPVFVASSASFTGVTMPVQVSPQQLQMRSICPSSNTTVLTSQRSRGVNKPDCLPMRARHLICDNAAP
jgi:hypothetical protein